MALVAVVCAYNSTASDAYAGSLSNPITVRLALPNTSRVLPLIGFGTELVWQSTNDTGLLARASAKAGSAVARYPGGTPANYWDWACAINGTCCTEKSFATGQSGKCRTAMGQALTTIQDWAEFVQPTAEPGNRARATVFDLNVVQTNASYQLEGLRQFAAAGVEVDLVELGNELFDPYQAQGLCRTGAQYRAAMQPYIDAVAKAYPQAQIALVGHEFHGGRTAVAWNSEVFNGSVGSAADAHAATVHIYTVVKTAGINNTTVVYRAPELLSSAWQFPLAQHGFLEATIPPRYRLWVTEFGHRGRKAWGTPEIDGTWLQGLYTGAALMLMLRTPRVDIALPYCLVCGLDNSPAFTAGPLNGTANGAELPPALADKATWALTPKGALVSEVMHAVAARAGTSKHSTNFMMRELVFSPDLPLGKDFAGTSLMIGWGFVHASTDRFDGAVLLYLGGNTTTLDLAAVLGEAGGGSDADGGGGRRSRWEMAIYYQPSMATHGPGVLLWNMTSVVREVVPVPASGYIVQVPPYSVLRLDAAPAAV